MVRHLLQSRITRYNNGGQNMPDVALSGGQSSSFRSDPYNVDQRGFLNDIVVCSLFLLLSVLGQELGHGRKS